MCVKSLGENEDTSTDYEYWNIPREIEESSASEEECTALSFASERADKQLAGSSSYEDDYQWLYFSHTKRGWMCKIVTYIHTVEGHQKEHCQQGLV